MTETEKNVGGRPAYKPDDRTRQIVKILAGFSMEHRKIAKVLGIDHKTMYKYYGQELDEGAAFVESQLMGNLLRIASGSDGNALRAIMFALNCRFGWSQYAPAPAAKEEPLGKKAQLIQEAHTGHRDTSWGDLLQ